MDTDNCLASPGSYSWTSARFRAHLRKKLHMKITSSGKNEVTAAVTVAKWLLKKQEGLETGSRQANFEILAMAAHVCESYDVRDPHLVDTITRGIFTLSNNDHTIWFQFLNPFGNVNSLVTTDSLYPFRPSWKSYNELKEKTWITPRHLKALDYYLNAANKYLFLVHGDFARNINTPKPCDPPAVVLVQEPVPNINEITSIDGYYLSLNYNRAQSSPNQSPARINVDHESHIRFSQEPREVFSDTSSDSSYETTPTSPLYLSCSGSEDSEVSGLTQDLEVRLATQQNGRCRPVGVAPDQELCLTPTNSRMSPDSMDSSETPESPEESSTRTHTRDSSTGTDGENVNIKQRFGCVVPQSFNTDVAPVGDSRRYIGLGSPGAYLRRTLSVQTYTYIPVSLVNFPLESSLMGTMMPLTLACLQGAHDAALLLLRHGASPLHGFDGFAQNSLMRHDYFHPLHACVSQLNLCSNDILAAFRNHRDQVQERPQQSISQIQVPPIHRPGAGPGYHSVVLHQRGSDWLQCLVLLCSVMKTWPIKLTEVQLNRTESWMDLRQVPEAEIPAAQVAAGGLRLSAEFAEYLPDMCQGRAPLTLQHQCRCAVRDRLYALRRLPHDIDNLPLPTAVKKYLNLETL